MPDSHEHAVILRPEAFKIPRTQEPVLDARALGGLERGVAHLDACMRDSREVSEVEKVGAEQTPEGLRLTLHAAEK